MRKLAIGIVAVLCLGATAAAQTAQADPPVTVTADNSTREPSGRITYDGNVLITIAGVVVRADRAVIQDGEALLDGSVRLTLPKSTVYRVRPIRRRVQTPAPPPPLVPTVPRPIFDLPIPQPWQPPPRDAR